MGENPSQYENLGQSSEQQTDRLENIEAQLGIVDINTSVSDDLRLIYFQIQSAIKDDSDNGVLQEAYNNILQEYSSINDGEINSMQEYGELSKELLADLGALKTVDGDLLMGTQIDASYFDVAVAVVDGTVEAGKQIYNDLKEMFAFLDPATFAALWETLKNSKLFDEPLDFLTDMFDAIQKSGGDFITDVQRDFQLIKNNSTGTGETAMNIEYGIKTGLPIVFSFLDPLKFLKVFKLMKIAIPEDVIAAIKKKGDIEDIPSGGLMALKEQGVRQRATMDPTIWRMPEEMGEIQSMEVKKIQTQTQGQVKKILARNGGKISAMDRNGNLFTTEVSEALIRDIASITDNGERRTRLKEFMPHFQDKQLDAVIKAHELGGNIFELKHGDIKAKMQVMQEAGMSKDEIKKVMDLGFAGNNNPLDRVFNPLQANVGLEEWNDIITRMRSGGEKKNTFINLGLAEADINKVMDSMLEHFNRKAVTGESAINAMLENEAIARLSKAELRQVFTGFDNRDFTMILDNITDADFQKMQQKNISKSVQANTVNVINPRLSLEDIMKLDTHLGVAGQDISQLKIAGFAIPPKDITELTNAVAKYLQDGTRVEPIDLINAIKNNNSFTQLNKQGITELFQTVQSSVEDNRLQELITLLEAKVGVKESYFSGTLGFDKKIAHVVDEIGEVVVGRFGKIDIDRINNLEPRGTIALDFSIGDGVHDFATLDIVKLPNGKFKGQIGADKYKAVESIEDLLQNAQGGMGTKYNREILFEMRP